MERREYLGSLVAAGGFTGCVTSESEQTPTGEPIPDSSVDLQGSVMYRRTVDRFGVAGPTNDQFAFVSVPESTAGDPPSAFELRIGGRSFEPIEKPNWRELLPVGEHRMYTTEEPHGRLLFDVPTVEAESAALVHDGTTHPVADTVVDQLERAPEFVVQSVETPDSVARGTDITVSLDVANEGSSDGTFRGMVQLDSLPRPFEKPVSAGASASISVTLTARGEDAASLDVLWGRDSRSIRVQITE
jgi:hypothetical protein